MSKSDKIKEEIGWLKIVFALLVATDISLMGWVALNFAKISMPFLFLAILAVFGITLSIVILNRRAYKKFDELEDL